MGIRKRITPVRSAIIAPDIAPDNRNLIREKRIKENKRRLQVIHIRLFHKVFHIRKGRTWQQKSEEVAALFIEKECSAVLYEKTQADILREQIAREYSR